LPGAAYSEIEDEPFESRLLFQSHRAWLGNGEAVTVKVIHCEIEEYLAPDVALLPLLKSALANIDLTEPQIESAISDFRSTLERRMNFVVEAAALEQYGEDSKSFEMLNAPVVYRDLCSSKVLTVKRLPGIGLDNIISQSGKGSGPDTSDLARTLFIVWLRQSLMGRSFPAEPRPENSMMLPSGQIAFTGGLFASLPVKAKAQLYAYLIAVATEDTDKACACLIGETNKQDGACSEDDLLHRFRQAVPFRDGGWSDAGNGDSLIERLFLHWRIASRNGYLPQPHLLSFYRGLFLISALARRLAPERDLLMESVDALRFMSVLEQFQQMIAPQQVSENLNKYAVMMIELPQKLDQMLTLVADGSARMKLQIGEKDTRGRQKNASAVIAGALLVLTSIVLLSNQLAATPVAQVWGGRIATIAFVLIGALLLRAVNRLR
jgi:predicted unusual protein kinase regulating ubiquinone biosynthesis (AarF/ABC1/UbiB family)